MKYTQAVKFSLHESFKFGKLNEVIPPINKE